MTRRPNWLLELADPNVLVIHSDYSHMDGVIAWGFVLVHKFRDKTPDIVFHKDGGVFNNHLDDVDVRYMGNIYEELAGRKAYEYINSELRLNRYEQVLHLADHPYAFSDENKRILSKRFFPEVETRWIHRGNKAHSVCREKAKLKLKEIEAKKN